MSQRDDADLFERFSRRLAGIEPDVAAPPPWRPPVERQAQDARTRGRSHMAWSATTAAAAVAIIALGAGFLVTNAPRQPQVAGQTAAAAGSPSPAGSIAPTSEAVLATGTIGTCSMVGQGETEDVTPDGIFQHREVMTLPSGRAKNECPITMTDPRLTGTLSFSMNLDYFGVPEPDPGLVSWGTWRLTADDGTWEGDYTGWGEQWPGTEVKTGWLKGSGAYEGLSASFHVVANGHWLLDGEVEAMIFPGNPPPDR
jgi:hypothetical protein